jgi:hypothetical protein
VCYSIIVGGDGLVEVGLKIFDFGLEHNVVGFTVLFFELVKFSLLLLELLSYSFQGILYAEIFSFLLLEFASIVINLSLQSL